MSLSQNLENIQHTLPAHVRLIVVSKNQSVGAIEELYHAGQRDFGENKIQELYEKDQATQHLSDIRWHMIGHIQTNKLKKLLSISRLQNIHSVDREELLHQLEKLQSSISNPGRIGLFWEINLTKDNTKYGFKSLEAVKSLLGQYSRLPKFYYQGFMCMGPSQDDEHLTQTQQIFYTMKEVKDSWTKDAFYKTFFPFGIHLSMGMSHDYVLAIQAGSDNIRVGSKVFSK